MRLAVDASTLVAEMLRERGRRLLENRAFVLVVATEVRGETEHELNKRDASMVRHGHLSLDAAEAVRARVEQHFTDRIEVVPRHFYGVSEGEATWRMPRDPKDVPTVALALTFECGIWTGDRDFFGCGVPGWTTETLLGYLDYHADL